MPVNVLCSVQWSHARANIHGIDTRPIAPEFLTAPKLYAEQNADFCNGRFQTSAGSYVINSHWNHHLKPSAFYETDYCIFFKKTRIFLAQGPHFFLNKKSAFWYRPTLLRKVSRRLIILSKIFKMKSVVWMCFDADSVVEPVFQNEQRTQGKELTTTIVPSIGPRYRTESKIPVRSNWGKSVSEPIF